MVVTVALLSTISKAQQTKDDLPAVGQGYEFKLKTAKNTKIGKRFGSTVCPEIVDWNSDGKFDLLVGTFGSPQVYIFINVGSNEKPKFADGQVVKAGGNAISQASW